MASTKQRRLVIVMPQMECATRAGHVGCGVFDAETNEPIRGVACVEVSAEPGDIMRATISLCDFELRLVARDEGVEVGAQG